MLNVNGYSIVWKNGEEIYLADYHRLTICEDLLEIHVLCSLAAKDKENIGWFEEGIKWS